MVRGLGALLLAFAAPATAQTVVTSPQPEAVSVTIYRGGDGELDLDDLAGYALVTETRTVDLVAGANEIRFVGVAGGILPASAIVVGLPGGTGEKNRDARLLSPGALVDAGLNGPVRLRRTNPATGRTTESDAQLMSGPDGVILRTADGVEALRCSGLRETLVYPDLPTGLSDKPTLGVTTQVPTAARATLRLSYLATGFDWRANYVAALRPDGRSLDLFAWLTLANGNDESFAAAQTSVVAGAINREDDDDGPTSSVPFKISLQCWPQGRTSDPAVPPPARLLDGVEDEGDYDEIIVTGSRVMRKELTVPVAVVMAQQEQLGDLKLYRVPEPVTVASHAQKQVALLTKPRVPFERLYGADLEAMGEREGEPVSILLRLRNETKRGLGLPLPKGVVAMFETVDGRPVLAGEADVDDKAVGERVELRVGGSPQVRIKQRMVRDEDEDEVRGEARLYEVEISNARDDAVTVEVLLRLFEDRWRLTRPSRKLVTRDGRQVWLAKVPAHGRATLTYTMHHPSHQDEKDDSD